MSSSGVALKISKVSAAPVSPSSSRLVDKIEKVKSSKRDRLNKLEQLLGPGNYGRIAKKSGYTRQHVGRVLRAENGTTLESARTIATAAGVTIDQLHEYISKQRPPEPTGVKGVKLKAQERKLLAARRKGVVRTGRMPK